MSPAGCHTVPHKPLIALFIHYVAFLGGGGTPAWEKVLLSHLPNQDDFTQDASLWDVNRTFFCVNALLRAQMVGSVELNLQPNTEAYFIELYKGQVDGLLKIRRS